MSANQLVTEATPGLGHNRPPLAEQIEIELAPWRDKQGELLGVAKTAVIIDDASAGKVVDLERLMYAFDKELVVQHEALKRPYLDACRAIDTAFAEVRGPVAVARNGADGRGGLRAMLSAWRRRIEEAAEAERDRLSAEQRVREAEAASARRAVEEKRASGSANIADELTVMQAEDHARRLAQQAEAIRPAPIQSHLGTVGVRRDITSKIVDLRKLLGWMLKTHGIAGQIEQAACTIVGKYLRGLGVAALERGIDIPGLEVTIERSAQVR